MFQNFSKHSFVQKCFQKQCFHNCFQKINKFKMFQNSTTKTCSFFVFKKSKIKNMFQNIFKKNKNPKLKNQKHFQILFFQKLCFFKKSTIYFQNWFSKTQKYVSRKIKVIHNICCEIRNHSEILYIFVLDIFNIDNDLNINLFMYECYNLLPYLRSLRGSVQNQRDGVEFGCGFIVSNYSYVIF